MVKILELKSTPIEVGFNCIVSLLLALQYDTDNFWHIHPLYLGFSVLWHMMGLLLMLGTTRFWRAPEVLKALQEKITPTLQKLWMCIVLGCCVMSYSLVTLLNLKTLACQSMCWYCQAMTKASWLGSLPTAWLEPEQINHRNKIPCKIKWKFWRHCDTPNQLCSMIPFKHPVCRSKSDTCAICCA